MTGEPGLSPPPPSVEPDLVERTLERAAEKVAATTAQHGPAGMNRAEAFVAVAVLLIVNVANLFVTIQNRTEVEGNRRNQAIICQLLSDLTGPAQVDVAKVARCLR